MMFSLRSLVALCLCLLPLCCLGRSDVNPYKVLGVSRKATDDDIRRNYRKLCLKYHPDKNVSKPDKERQRCEETFKRVQKAYSQIGDEESRRQYDNAARQEQLFSGSDNPLGAYFFSAGFPEYRETGGEYFTRRRRPTPFYVNGIDISQLFRQDFRQASPVVQNLGFGSVYVQKVTVPLQDLYTGGKEADLVLKDTIWKRYRAAFRGGAALPVAIQAIFFCLPLVSRVRVSLLMIVMGILFHAGLPRPNVFNYQAELQKGWKGGTKLTFKNEDPGIEVVFVLQEGKHDRFRRVGNDLVTTVRVDRDEALNGCTIQIDPMDELEDPITLELKPNQIKMSGDVVRIQGRGWPRRKRNDRGDLLVTVKIRRRKRKSEK